MNKLIFKGSLLVLTVLASLSLLSCGEDDSSKVKASEERTDTDITDTNNNNNYSKVDTEKTYTITWKNSDGKVLETDTNVKKGDTPSYDRETPIKESDNEYNYIFSGWSPELKSVDGDTTYTALYNSSERIYSATFKNEDGSLIQDKVTYSFNSNINDIVPANPTKESTDEYDYEFDKWKEERTNDDFVYTASFKAIKRKYKVTFVNYDDSIIEENYFEYGTTPECSITPTKQGDKRYEFSFDEWDNELSKVTGDTVYKAKFTEKDKMYSIKFYVDGEIYYSDYSLRHLDDIVAPTNPTKESNAQYTYEFDGWYDKDGNKVTEFGEIDDDVCYYGYFKQITNKYKITFKNADGSLLKTEYYEYGKMPSYSYTPTMDKTAQYTYTFTNWDKDIVLVTEEATYTAVYDVTVNTYTYKFYDNKGNILSSGTLEYGKTYDVPEVDSQYEESLYIYTFDGWYTRAMYGEKVTEFPAISKNVVYYAVYTPNRKKVTLYFDSNGGSKVDPITQEWETKITPPEDPKKDGYVFAGWKPSIPDVMPTGPMTCVATWVEAKYKINVEISDNTLASTNITSGAEYYYNDPVHFEADIAAGYGYQLYYNDKAVDGTILDFDMPQGDVTIKVEIKTYLRKGNTLIMGAYPETKVTDTKLIAELDKLAGDMNGYNNDWESYKYYDGTSQSNYMWYKDLTIGFNKYRAVYFTKYRPDYSKEANQDNSFVDDNKYELNKIYYFKYESIEWTIYEETDGVVRLISNIVLDSQVFCHRTDTSKTSYNSTNSIYTSYANNYFYSDIKIWLNSTSKTIDQTHTNNQAFYYYAFNSAQKNKINKLGFNSNSNFDDYVYLSTSEAIEALENKKCSGTDYAMMQGLEVASDGAAAYYTSASGDANNMVKYVTANGEISSTYCYYSHIGIRPIIRMTL